jgi:hypothetical protein
MYHGYNVLAKDHKGSIIASFIGRGDRDLCLNALNAKYGTFTALDDPTNEIQKPGGNKQ